MSQTSAGESRKEDRCRRVHRVKRAQEWEAPVLGDWRVGLGSSCTCLSNQGPCSESGFGAVRGLGKGELRGHLPLLCRCENGDTGVHQANIRTSFRAQLVSLSSLSLIVQMRKMSRVCGL